MKIVLTSTVRAVITHVVIGLRVPKASDATGVRPTGMIQLTTRIHVSVRMARSSSSSPRETTIARPVFTSMPQSTQIFVFGGRDAPQLGHATAPGPA